MELPELLMMHPVARLVRIEKRKHEARLLFTPTNTACGLDVLGGRFWLPLHKHQPESADVETDRDHVRRHCDIDAFAIGAGKREAFLCLGHLIRAYTRGQLQWFA